MNAASPQRRPSLVGGLALCFATVVLCLLAGEIIGRILSPSASLWHYPNYIWRTVQVDKTYLSPLRYDPELGYEPRPGASSLLKGQPISYSADGLRNQNLGAPPAGGRAILAVGDSFTEGYAVTDDESWPAHLERDTGRRVLNAGVRGYGLDQVVLRAERLAPRFKPGTFVLAFIFDDIGRSTLSVREFMHKPYFVPAGQGLELRNVPVPATPTWGHLDLARRILGHSYLLDFVMRRLGAYELWYGDSVHADVDGDLVACRLMDRFAALVRRQEAKALVVAFPQYDGWIDPPRGAREGKRVAAVLACAGKAGLATLDTHGGFAAAGAARDTDAFYAEHHFNDRGNALAAKLIAAALETAEE